MALSIISLNVNGLRESSKREGLLQWLRSLSVTVDVVFLQETHCTSDVECHSWFSFSGFSFVLSPGTRRSGGCIVLYRPVLTLVNYWCEVPGRSLMCEFSFHDATFCVLCLYAPNRNPARDLFFNSISVDAVDLLTLPSLRFCAVTSIRSSTVSLTVLAPPPMIRPERVLLP